MRECAEGRDAQNKAKEAAIGIEKLDLQAGDLAFMYNILIVSLVPFHLSSLTLILTLSGRLSLPPSLWIGTMLLLLLLLLPQLVHHVLNRLQSSSIVVVVNPTLVLLSLCLCLERLQVL